MRVAVIVMYPVENTNLFNMDYYYLPFKGIAVSSLGCTTEEIRT